MDKAFQILSKAVVTLWAMGLVTYAVVQFFTNYALTEMAHATVLTAIIGIPGVAFTYRWFREGKFYDPYRPTPPQIPGGRRRNRRGPMASPFPGVQGGAHEMRERTQRSGKDYVDSPDYDRAGSI